MSQLVPGGSGAFDLSLLRRRAASEGLLLRLRGLLATAGGNLLPQARHTSGLNGARRPEPILDGEGRPLRWTTVAQYSDSQAADAPRIRLEAEGIPTFLDGERMGSRAMYHVATGGVRLKVPDTLAEDARIILSQTWSATAAQLDIDDEFEKEDFDDQDSTEDEHASHPHDLSVGYNFLIFLALGLPSLLLAYLLLRYLY